MPGEAQKGIVRVQKVSALPIGTVMEPAFWRELWYYLVSNAQ